MASINTALPPNNISLSTEIKDKLYSTIKKSLLLNKNNSSDLTTVYQDFNEEFRKFCIDTNNPLLKNIAEDLNAKDLENYRWSENDPYGIALAKRLFRLLSTVSNSQDLNKGLSSFSGLIKDKKNLYSFSRCLFERSIQQKDAKTALATLNAYSDQLIDRRMHVHLHSSVFENLIDLVKIGGKSIGSSDYLHLFQRAYGQLPSIEKDKTSEKEIVASLKILIKNLAYKKSNDLLSLGFNALSRLPIDYWDEELQKPIKNILNNIDGIENNRIKEIQIQFNQKFLKKKTLPDANETKEEKKIADPNELELFSYEDLARKSSEFNKFINILKEFHKKVNDHSKSEFCNIVSILNYVQATKNDQAFNQKHANELKVITNKIIEKLFILEKGNAVMAFSMAVDNILDLKSDGFYQAFKNQINIYACSFDLFITEAEIIKKIGSLSRESAKNQANKFLTYLIEMSLKLEAFSCVCPELTAKTIFKMLDLLFWPAFKFDEETALRIITFLFKLAKCQLMKDKTNSSIFYSKLVNNIEFIYNSKDYSNYRKIMTSGVLSLCIGSFIADESILRQNPELLDQLAVAKIQGFTIVCANDAKDQHYHAIYFTNLLAFLKLLNFTCPINEFYLKFKNEMNRGVGMQYDSSLETFLSSSQSPSEFVNKLLSYFYSKILKTTKVTSYKLQVLSVLNPKKQQ